MPTSITSSFPTYTKTNAETAAAHKSLFFNGLSIDARFIYDGLLSSKFKSKLLLSTSKLSQNGPQTLSDAVMMFMMMITTMTTTTMTTTTMTTTTMMMVMI